MNDIQHFAKLTKDIKFAMFTTVSRDGTLRSRPMTLQQNEFDGTLWFFADRWSHLASDIGDGSRVNLSFADIKNNSYLSASGQADVVFDKAKERELWNPFYKAWFPEGLEDTKLCLIKVTVESADYWESPSSPLIHLVGFAKAVLTGQRPAPGLLSDTGHLNLN